MARRRLRKSSVILLICICCVLSYKLFVTYFHHSSGVCYNEMNRIVSNKLFLSVEKEESLGDLMFQYASLLGLANLNSRRAWFPANTVLENLFNVRFVFNGNTDCWTKKPESIPMGFDISLTSLPQGNVSIQGYLQSWKYFHSIEQTIRNEFRFKSYILKETKNRFNTYVDHTQEGIVIGVHILRNNLLTMGGSIHVHNIAPLSYVQKAMKHMRSKFKKVKFLVLCDDNDWCRAFLKDIDVVVAEESDSSHQLALLSLCDHSIITVGTLGYWGAWLANGYTVFYKDYIRQQSTLWTKIRYEDFFPSHWIPLGD